MDCLETETAMEDPTVVTDLATVEETKDVVAATNQIIDMEEKTT